MSNLLLSCSKTALVALLLGGCVPEFEEDLSRVSSGTILAVRAEPAEVKESQRVSLGALVATDPDEPFDDTPTFRFCVARKPLSELGPVDTSCLSEGDESEALVLLGSGEQVEAVVPETACMSFGPRRPPPEPGKPAARPVDPDPTGGYYQPVVAKVGDTPSVLGAVRLDCGIIGANRDQVIEYNQRFRANLNPAVATLEIRQGNRWVELTPVASGDVTRVRGSVQSNLRVTWKDCDEQAPECEEEECSPPVEGCAGAETYVSFDSRNRTIVERRESLSASWYANDGTFETYRSEPSSEGATSATNSWTAPRRAGRVSLWVVLRDGRGGVGWQSYVVEVE